MPKDAPSPDQRLKESEKTPAVKENAEKPWGVAGTAIYADGQPVEGATVEAFCGVGTCFQTGQTTTDAQGKYLLHFGPGMTSLNPGGPKLTWRESVDVQSALISISKPGYFEKNLHEQGRLAMAGKLPSKNTGWNIKPEQIVLPDKPYRLDFVMVPAAVVEGRLIDDQGRPIADKGIGIFSEKSWPGTNILASGKTDAQGRFRIDEIPTNHALWFEYDSAATAPTTLSQGQKAFELKYSPAVGNGKKTLSLHSVKPAGSP
jgi:hypothetical protein